MQRKSRFFTVLFSFVPGLGHLYLGFAERAVVFFGLFFAAIASALLLNSLTRGMDFTDLLVIGLPLLWLISLVDAISILNRHFRAELRLTEGAEAALSAGNGNDNRKLIAVSLSIVPGAGHMYLGLMQKGVQLMAGFFFALFLMGWLNVSLFIFILPVIWFYSLFDAMHRVDAGDGAAETEDPFSVLVNTYPKLLGWGLIGLGCLAVFDRIISPFLSWAIRNYLQTGIVATLLIASGAKLIIGSRSRPDEEVKVCREDE
ncbi:MAG: hypothetical protein ACOX8W_08215 [bacterium]